MPQFDSHAFLKLMPNGADEHEFVLALIAFWNGVWHPVGTAFLVAPNLLVTAKHILANMIEDIAGQKIPKYDGFGIKLKPRRLVIPYGMGLDALQFMDNRRSVRRFSGSGCFEVGEEGENCDLAMVLVAPHPECMHQSRLISNKIPVLDLYPPKVDRPIIGYGYPDHPDHKDIACDQYLSKNYLYQSEGVVQAINFNGSASFISFQTSMPTWSGMSGGPVFVERSGERTFCGIISKSDENSYSQISPLWQLAQTYIDHQPGMPERNGYSLVYDMLKDQQIKNVGNEYLSLDEDRPGVDFDYKQVMLNGY